MGSLLEIFTELESREESLLLSVLKLDTLWCLQVRSQWTSHPLHKDPFLSLSAPVDLCSLCELANPWSYWHLPGFSTSTPYDIKLTPRNITHLTRKALHVDWPGTEVKVWDVGTDLYLDGDDTFPENRQVKPPSPAWAECLWLLHYTAQNRLSKFYKIRLIKIYQKDSSLSHATISTPVHMISCNKN